ncbi:unnamed protein product [Periconia digitata]|uniref:Zn(2)-C6 fungal-type domain-containing protein n=1 Tax=Periconia digitata TaxID=1303443 RepID=A0A9W4UFX0_9PLEO|nr:unnamed protein product [Periconia digitata]
MEGVDNRDRDQACNECRRRKARCDKLVPECSPCKKNKRHCLYARNSKTPLTRKYLTEIEEQLRRAQLQAVRAEDRARLAESRLQSQSQSQHASIPEHSDSEQFTIPPENVVEHAATEDAGTYATDEPPLSFEGPPSGPADFSWDEQSPEAIQTEIGVSQSYGSPEEDDRTADGMASLTVDENEAGYLGVASGAAMLRLLLPDANHDRPARPTTRSSRQSTQPANMSNHLLETPLWDKLRLFNVDFDAAINGYFGLYHNSYPLVEEHTFRAQFGHVIPRPNGRSWHALAFIIAAIGHFTTATDQTDTDRRLFIAAQSNLSIESLETGNITLVQTLTLMSNYLQKKNKPNSGYNYLGLALHMAMGLGLHKEFQGWDISPLNMEIRRRVWWCIFVFNVGAAITFGRPVAWPGNVELSLPLNVSSRAINNLSRSIPSEADHITTYSAVIMQSKFHMLTNDIYARVISMPYPTTAELIRLDDDRIKTWESKVPSWYSRDATVPPQFATGHAIMWWRKSNFRIIMYRPYVMRHVLQARSQESNTSMPQAAQEAYNRCLHEAEISINTISSFWSSASQTRLAAWYALYFLFQASLIPCVCLRNTSEPSSPMAQNWRSQIRQTMHTMKLISPTNPSAQECYNVIQRLCGPFLHPQPPDQSSASLDITPGSAILEFPTQESPQTQINNVYAMMWPNANPSEVDVLMQDGMWTGFFPDTEDGTQQPLGGPNSEGAMPYPWT